MKQSNLDPVTQKLIDNSKRIKVLEEQLVTLSSMFYDMKDQFSSKKVVEKTVPKSTGKKSRSKKQKTQSEPLGARHQTLPQQQEEDDQEGFYTTVSKGLKLAKNDNVASIVTKMISFTEEARKQKQEFYDSEKKFKDAADENEKDFRTKFLDAIKALKVKPKVKGKRELPPRDALGRFVKKEATQTLGKEAAKDAAKSVEKEVARDAAQAAERQVVQTTERQVAKETVKKTAEKLETVEAPSIKQVTQIKPPEVTAPPPSVSPILETIKQAAPTAAKVVAGVAVTSLFGKEAIAESISKYESKGAGDYNAYNKGTVGNKMIGADKPIDFSKMTISEFLQRGGLQPGDPNRLFAVGRYQIIPKTMEGLVKKLKLDPDTTYLDKETQDSLFANGLIGTVRKKVNDYIEGKSEDRNAAILELAKEFASVGVPYDMEIGTKKLKKGDSYYSGQGGNKAHNSPEEVGRALDIDRAKHLKNTSDMLEPKNDVGQKLNQSSINNRDLKGSGSGTNVIMDNTTTNVTTVNKKEEIVVQPTTNDIKPIHMESR
jgi:hypothetical protein